MSVDFDSLENRSEFGTLATPRLQAVFSALLIGSKGLDEPALTLAYENCLAVDTAKGQVRRLTAAQDDFMLKSAIGRHDGDHSSRDPRDQ